MTNTCVVYKWFTIPTITGTSVSTLSEKRGKMNRPAFLLQVLLGILSSDICTPAVISTFEDEEQLEDFCLVKRMQLIYSTHITSYTDELKEQICDDILQSDFFEVREIAYARRNYESTFALLQEAERETGNEYVSSYYKIDTNGQRVPSYPIKIQTFRLSQKSYGADSMPELTFVCLARQIVESGAKKLKEFHISYSFMERGYFVYEGVADGEIRLKAFAELTPTVAEWGRNELELHYHHVRRNVENFRTRSFQLVYDIEENDSFANVSRNHEERRRLCSAIFETKRYKNQGLRFTSQYRGPKSGVTVAVAFENPDYKNTEWPEEYLNCKVHRGTVTESFYIIRSYSEATAVYVLKKEDSGWFLDAYVRNIPVLMSKHAELLRAGYDDFGDKQEKFLQKRNLVVEY